MASMVTNGIVCGHYKAGMVRDKDDCIALGMSMGLMSEKSPEEHDKTARVATPVYSPALRANTKSRRT